jgi:hypothetical protein
MKFRDYHWLSIVKVVEIISYLTADEGFSFVTLVTMVDRFDTGLETKSDKETDGDREQVEEEVTDAVDSVFWRMNVEHVGSYCFELVPVVRAVFFDF